MATLDEVLTAVVRLEGKVEAVMASTAEHHSTLYGNGREGHNARLQRVEDLQRACPARSSWIWTFRGWIALAGVLIGSIAAAAAIIRAIG